MKSLLVNDGLHFKFYSDELRQLSIERFKSCNGYILFQGHDPIIPSLHYHAPPRCPNAMQNPLSKSNIKRSESQSTPAGR